MIDAVTRVAFADELEKIALGLPQFGQIMREGLIGAPSQGVLLRGLGIAGTAAQINSGLRQGLAKEDPYGRGRSRAERLSGFGGEMTGSILGSGLATHGLAHLAERIPAGKAVTMIPGQMRSKLPWWANLGGVMAGGIIGGLAGRKITASPFALKRKLLGQNVPPPQPGEDGAWRNQAPGVGAPAHSPTEGRGLL